MNKEKILIVEDDVDINNLIMEILEDQGYEAVQAFSGSEAMLQLKIEDFQMILLDLMLPKVSGEELIKYIRKEKEMPIVVISAKTSLEEKVNCLNIGADDYITKPFHRMEIVARVNSQIRRYKKFSYKNSNEINIYEFKNLVLKEDSRQVTVNGNNVELTAHEFDILCILMKNPNKVYSREKLYEKVWNNGYYGEDNSVNMHISNIRKKIKEVDKNEEYIKTVWGIGFKLNN